MAKLHTNTHSFIINNNNNIIKEIKNNQVRITFYSENKSMKNNNK